MLLRYFDIHKIEITYTFMNLCKLLFRNINALSANPIKSSNTQTIRRQQLTNCLSVFDHFVGLVLRGLGYISLNPQQNFKIFEKFIKIRNKFLKTWTNTFAIWIICKL